MLFTDTSNLTIVKSLDRSLLEVPVRFTIKDEQIEEDFAIEIGRISTEFQVDKLPDKVLSSTLSNDAAISLRRSERSKSKW